MMQGGRENREFFYLFFYQFSWMKIIMRFVQLHKSKLLTARSSKSEVNHSRTSVGHIYTGKQILEIQHFTY